MLIALTGFMGSGKTSVGRIVADALGCPFLDLDEVIVKKAGRSIPAIFEADGEKGFRRLEKQALEQTVAKYSESTAVLALGGGTVTVPGAIGLLQEKTLCIYLQADEETLRGNLEGRTEGRPLAGEGWEARLAERLPLYEKAAHVILDTNGLAPEEIADEIIISCL
ncbi:MAG: shikimate kinase [Bacteroidales bacterium]|nr:shikimate kinase [Bacteroidales bacterium]